MKLQNYDLKSLAACLMRAAKRVLPLLLIALLLQVQTVRAAGVYDNQPPFTRKELSDFIELLPQFRAWAKAEREDSHPKVNGKGQADFLFSPKAAAWVKSKGWEPPRFFCVMGRAAAALYIVAEGNELPTNYPKDMPKVSQEELNLVRGDLSRLLKAGSETPQQLKK